jgi:hypothetical protein
MRRDIPGAVLAICAEITSGMETHASLDGLYIYAGASGDPPLGSKHVKALAWLRATNKDPASDPLKVLGKIIEPIMDKPDEPSDRWDEYRAKAKVRLGIALADSQLKYVAGGVVIPAGMGTPTKALSDFIRAKDYAAIELEFQRALENVEAKPREAVSAASNILESVCRVVIEDEGLAMPAKEDLQGLWNAVRKHLGMDPGVLQDKDLQQILSGLISVVHGIGALRTHASSAHGAGRKVYKLEPRHARLAIHSAHTIALFVLESWQRKQTSV